MNRFVFLVYILFVISPGLNAQKVSQFSLQEIQSAVNEASKEYRGKSVQYLLPLETTAATDIQHLNLKINKGDFYFSKGDFVSASNIYYSIFSSRALHDTLWGESLFKLGRALFFTENYISAMRYLELLLSDNAGHEYREQALKCLIESAYRMGDHDAALRYYTAFVESGADFSKYPDLIYFLAKSLYLNNATDDALNLFLMIKVGETYHLQALYFIAVMDMERGSDSAALKRFLEIVKLQPSKKYWKYDTVHATAILAVARLYFHMGRLPEATQYYLMVDHKSPLFAEAYYELCWTYIRRKMYTRAISALALIRYISPNSVILPEAELLEGTLMIQTKKFGEAMVHFSNLASRYTGVLEKLTSAEQSEVDGKSTVSIFSSHVQSLLNDSVKYKQALDLKRNLAVLEDEIKHVVLLKNRLESVLSNDNLASLYPPLKAGSEFSFVFHNRLVRYLDRLHVIMYEKISTRLSLEDAERWRNIDSKKQELVRSVALFSLDVGQFEQKVSSYTDTIILLREELHRTSLQTKSLLEQVRVLELLITRKDENSRATRSVKKERVFGEEYLKSLEKSQLDVEEEKNRLLLRGDLLSKTIILRREYLKLLYQESDILRNYLNGLGSDALSISRLENDITGLIQKTEFFSRKLNGMVRRTLYNVREIYETERRKIEHYQSQVKELLNSVDDLARLALFSNINKVKQTFNGIILQADQGVINVAWERKDGVSKELLKYRTKKAREIQRLNLNLEGLE